MAPSDEEPLLSGIADAIRADGELLVAWIDEDVAQLARVAESATSVRVQAEALVDVVRRSHQRPDLEEALYQRQRWARTLLEAVPSRTPEWEYLTFGPDPTLNAEGLGRGTVGKPVGWGPGWSIKPSDEVRRAEQDLLALAHAEHARREDARTVALRALGGMDECVEEALRLSRRHFGPVSASSSRARRAAATPFIVFLLVALAGIFVSPSPAAGWTAVGILIMGIVTSVAVVIHEGNRAGPVAALAAGSSLAIFASAYLVVRLLDPKAVLQGGEPVTSIGEAAFASLTIGTTGGTVGIDLNAGARIVAFIQILLTLTLIASGVGWAWRQTLRRLSLADPASREQPEADG